MANKTADRAFFEATRQHSSTLTGASEILSGGHSSSTRNGTQTTQQETLTGTFVLKKPTGFDILQQCSDRLKWSRSFIANASTIRDVLHDALEVLRSGEYPFGRAYADPTVLLTEINTHILHHPRAPNWAPYTYPDGEGENVELEIGVMPRFEILHRHGDTEFLAQGLLEYLVPRCHIDWILRHDALLHGAVTAMVVLREEVELAKARWKRACGRVDALKRYRLGREITVEQIQRLLTLTRLRRRGTLAKVDDAIVVEADLIVAAFDELDRQLKVFDDTRVKFLHRIADIHEISRTLLDLGTQIIGIEYQTGLRVSQTFLAAQAAAQKGHDDQHQTGQAGEADQASQADQAVNLMSEDDIGIGGDDVGLHDVSWNFSSGITLRHKTSKRFEQFPHHDYWFEVCLDYMKGEQGYLEEKVAGLLDDLRINASKLRALEEKIVSCEKPIDQAKATSKADPNNIEKAHNLVDLEMEKVGFHAQSKEEQGKRLLIIDRQFATAQLYYDLTLIIRLLSLRQNPAERAYQYLLGEQCRDIAELTIAIVENFHKTFELISQCPLPEQKRQLTIYRAIVNRFSTSSYSNHLTDSQLSSQRAWTGIYTRFHLQQRLTATFLSDIIDIVRTMDLDHNTQVLREFIANDPPTNRLAFGPGMNELKPIKVSLQPHQPRREPTAAQFWAFPRLYRFFTSPDIGPKFDNPEIMEFLDSGLQSRPWREPFPTFLRKVNTLVGLHITALEMKEFLATCHQRRLLFVYSARLNVISYVERGWGAINTNDCNLQEVPRRHVVGISNSENIRALVRLFQAYRDRVLELHPNRSIAMEELRKVAEAIRAGSHLMTPETFTQFIRHCKERGILFITRTQGRLIRVDSGWAPIFNIPLNIREFEQIFRDERASLGITENGTLVENFVVDIEVLRRRFNRVVESPRLGDRIELERPRLGPIEPEVWRGYVEYLTRERRVIGLRENGSVVLRLRS